MPQNNIYEFSSYLTGNALRLRYIDRSVREIVTLYSQNHTGHKYTLYIKPDGTYNEQFVLQLYTSLKDV
jgi:hypothetical protein